MSGDRVPAGDGVCDNCRDATRGPAGTPCRSIWRSDHAHPESVGGPSIPCGLMLCGRCARRLRRNLASDFGSERVS